MRKWFALVLCAGLLAGCSSFLPKRVELFQDKVERVPTPTLREKETQKQAAALAAEKAAEALQAALLEGSSPAVVDPAEDASILTLSLTKSLGPPLDPWDREVEVLARKLLEEVADLNRRLDKFAEDQRENEGKKIEGSGVFQVPYFVWLGGAGLFVVILIFVGGIVLKVASISNPAVAVGTRIASMGASRLARGFGQVVEAGEGFKDEIKSRFDEAQATVIKEIYRKHQERVQDNDVQAAIRELTK